VTHGGRPLAVRCFFQESKAFFFTVDGIPPWIVYLADHETAIGGLGICDGPVYWTLNDVLTDVD